MQDTGNAFEFKTPENLNNLVCVCVCVCTHCYQNLLLITNQKSTIDTHTYTKESNPNTTLKIVIKSQENKIRREEKKTYKSKTMNKNVNKNIFIGNTINVNRLNAQTKRHRQTEWIEKHTFYICCLQETHFRSRDTY